MEQAWIGDTVTLAPTTEVSTAARENGYGYAVWLTEETNVILIVSSEYFANLSKETLYGRGKVADYYGVRLMPDGTWKVTY